MSTYDKDARENKIWALSFFVWLVGAVPLYGAWTITSDMSGFFGEIAKFAVYVACFSYVFTIPLIRSWLEKNFDI